MTETLDRLSVRAESRVTGLVVVSRSAVVVLLIIIAQPTLETFAGGGPDMAAHYWLVHWFSHHSSLPPTSLHAIDHMQTYPPGAYIFAALVGHVVGSPFRGMQLVANAAIVLVWCAIGGILATLPGRRRWVALGALAVFLVLDRSGGPLRVQVHGFEIISNFFFSQAVGQAIVWLIAWFAVRRMADGRSPLSIAVPVAVVAVLATVVHLVPAVELLVLAGCLCAYELVRRWRADRRGLSALGIPAALPAVTAILIVLTPGFRDAQGRSTNNGGLVPEPFSGLAGYIAVAVAAVIVSLFVLAIAAGRAREQKTRAVLQGLGFLGIAIAAPCLVQALALADGQGSPYAVKKYIFGLLTVLVIDACAVAAALVPRLGPGEDRSSRGSTRFAAVVALTAVAVLSIFSHQGARYSTSAITTLERHVNEVASAAHLQGNARGYAIGLPGDSPFWPGHDPMLDFMFSLSTFAAPNGSVGGDVYEGQPAFSVSEFVTGVGSQFDDPACRRFGPRDGLVVIGTVCWRDDEMACRSVTFLGQGGPPIELGGFSVPEHGGRWTDGTTATFTCYLPRSEGRKPVTLALDAIAFVPFKGSRQRVTLVANGEQKRYLLTREMWHATLRLTVPQSSSRRLHLTLNLPDAVSPKQLRISIDPRVLGLYIGRIRIG